MVFLVAKIAGLLVLAALFGAVIGYLLARRRYVDASEEFYELQTQSKALQDRLEDGRHLEAWHTATQEELQTVKGIVQRAAVDLTPVEDRLATIHRSIAQSGGVKHQLDTLESRLAAFDWTGLEARLDRLAPLTDHLAAIEQRLSALEQQPRTASSIPSEVPPKLDHIEQLLADLTARLEHTPAESAWTCPMEQRVAALETQGLPPPSEQTVPVEPELPPANTDTLSLPRDAAGAPGGIDTETDEAPPASEPAPSWVDADDDPAPTFAEARRNDGSKNLLTSAVFGPPDPLREISGIGPVLEQMLHDLGVYYFWQIAQWLPEDVQDVDQRLTAFNGRIERDHWVEQATALMKHSPAQPPASAW